MTKMTGFSNSWTMPIKATDRHALDRHTHPDWRKGLRAGPCRDRADPVASGSCREGTVPGTRSAFAERVSQGYYLDFDINREAIARYGLSVMDVQEVIQAAVGGANVTQTIEGRQRYPVNVRYGRESAG